MKNIYTTISILIVLISCSTIAGGGNKGNDEEFSVLPTPLPEPGTTVYGKFRVGIDVNYFKSTDSYDKEGKSSEYSGMDVFSRLNQNIKFSYRVVDDAEALNSNWKIIDDGNYYSLLGGLAYDWDLDCGDLYFGLGLSYWGKTHQCYDDNEIDDSESNSLSLIPKVGFRLKSTPLNLYLSSSAKMNMGFNKV